MNLKKIKEIREFLGTEITNNLNSGGNKEYYQLCYACDCLDKLIRILEKKESDF